MDGKKIERKKLTIEEIRDIFKKAKAYEQKEQIQLRRAYGLPYERMSAGQKVIYHSISGDVIPKYQTEFIISMLALYVKNGCVNGSMKFQSYLKRLYKDGSPSTRQGIEYMIDERDVRMLMSMVLRYLNTAEKNVKIDLIQLTADMLAWGKNTKTIWIKTIAGTIKEEEA